MKNTGDNLSTPMADLIESAFEAAHPSRIASGSDYTRYRLPVDRLAGMWPDEQDAVLNRDEIQWSEGLKAAYRDGYDPLLWLGRGASSEVWRCVDRAFGREVALKIPCLEPGQDVDPAVAALQEEAELLGRLHHPGIVHAVRRAGEGRSAYLALDFIDGDDLFEHSRALRLDASARLKLFAKAIDAVAYLHDKGVVHGDLKPEHLLVREDNQPVIIDFGLSSYDDSADLHLDGLKRIGGSGIYRAPEIADGIASAPEPQHDVYSLGVILRELVRDVDLAERSDAVNDVICRATADEFDDRWPDARAMLTALQQVLKPQAEQASIAPAGRLSDTSTRSASIGKLLLAAAAVFVVVAGLAWVIATKPGPDRVATEPPGAERGQALSQRAALFELTLSNIYAGETEQAQEHLQSVAEQGNGTGQAWEQRYLQAKIAGEGDAYPFGEEPYRTSHARSVAYDPASGAIAYSKRGDENFELWIQHEGGPPRLVANSIEYYTAAAISPEAKSLAAIDMDGRLTIHPLLDGDDDPRENRELPIKIDARAIWFSPDGLSLYVFSPQDRVIERWSVSGPVAKAPSAVIDRCDHAYPLASGKGSFMVATAGENMGNGHTQLRLFNPAGEVTRTLALEDGLLPSCADTRPGDEALICLGMTNGYVRIFDEAHGGWQPACDLGLNAGVSAVVYSATEERVFAAMGRVHVIDVAGQLVMRLGDRNAHQQLIRSLWFDEREANLTCISVQDVWRYVAPGSGD